MPRGTKYIVLVIETNYPRRVFRVRDLTTGQVIMRKAIIWHPTADAGEAVTSETATKTGGGARHGHYSPRPKETIYHTFTLGSLEAVSEEPESEQHEPEGAGTPKDSFELERVEHETGEASQPKGATSEELKPEKSFLPEPEADESGEDSSDDESEPELDQGGQSGTQQEVPAAIRKRYDSFTGAPQPITQNRTRSGHDAASLQAPTRAVDVNHLPPEPTTLRQAQASPEWPNSRCVRKKRMDGQLARQASIRTMLGFAAVKYWRAAKRALQYPWRTKDFGITYGGTPGSCTKTVGMSGRRFRLLPRLSTLGFRRSGDAEGGRDQLVPEDAEDDRGRVIRIRVCGAGRSCK